MCLAELAGRADPGRVSSPERRIPGRLHPQLVGSLGGFPPPAASPSNRRANPAAATEDRTVETASRAVEQARELQDAAAALLSCTWVERIRCAVAPPCSARSSHACAGRVPDVSSHRRCCRGRGLCLSARLLPPGRARLLETSSLCFQWLVGAILFTLLILFCPNL